MIESMKFPNKNIWKFEKELEYFFVIYKVNAIYQGGHFMSYKTSTQKVM